MQYINIFAQIVRCKHTTSLLGCGVPLDTNMHSQNEIQIA